MSGLECHFRLKLGDFELEPSFKSEGRRLALFGESGAGKSLTLDVLAGLLKPETGRIYLGETAFFDRERKVWLPPQRRRIGYASQDPHLFPHLGVQENVRYGIPGGAPPGEVERLMKTLGLESLAGRWPSTLSGGQKQRVALARALASRPQLLLLDEPFSALDDLVRKQLRHLLVTTLDSLEIPSILVTHDLVEATMLSDVLIVLRQGQVVQLGPPAEVLREPASAYVARLVGMTNILETKRLSLGEGCAELQWESHKVLVPARKALPERMTIGIRPEDVRVVEHAGPNTYGAKVESVLEQGTQYLLRLKLGEGAHLDVLERAALARGERLLVQLPAESLHIF